MIFIIIIIIICITSLFFAVNLLIFFSLSGLFPFCNVLDFFVFFGPSDLNCEFLIEGLGSGFRRFQTEFEL